MKAIFFYFMMFLLVVVSLVFKMSHILPFLLTLEMMNLLFFIYILHISHSNVIDILILLFYIVIISIEATLGLVFFVCFLFYWSKDYVVTLSVLKF